MKFAWIIGSMAAISLLGACDVTTLTPMTSATEGDVVTLTEVPEGVVAIAAPNQDLTSVRIQPEDGCYWYRHVGPVETTYLPLRTTRGQPICSRPPEPPQPAVEAA